MVLMIFILVVLLDAVPVLVLDNTGETILLGAAEGLSTVAPIKLTVILVELSVGVYL